MTRRISDEGIEFIRKQEGCRLESYRDSVGVWTIGVGHTGPDVGPSMRITEEECDALLHSDLRSAESAVERLISVPLTDNQFAALVSFTFNLGQFALERSTLRKCLNMGNYQDAAREFHKWVRAGGRVLDGLVTRRRAESALFVADTQ